MVPVAINTALLLVMRVFLACLFVGESVFQPLVIGAWVAMFLDILAGV
ncbi:MAG: hypothetical protein GU361_01180 [Desulfurococcales archaeon]|nr:hypothetical protein [Desulfurococcales archaeon]